MIKRILSLWLTICIMASLIVALPITASAEKSIKIGDYLILGEYYDEPILWRCVDIDKNGPLMLSDKILCIKPFDVEGNGGSHDKNSQREIKGSSDWEDSNIRSWLNSDKKYTKIQWLCGNAPDKCKLYYGEDGFLSDFQYYELSLLKNAVQFTSQYSATVETIDKVFLLSKNQATSIGKYSKGYPQ